MRHGREGFELSGRVVSDRRTDLSFSWSRPDRIRLLNGSASSLAAYLDVLPVVAWTSADNELLTGPPRIRRRFLDQGVVGLRPVAIEVISRYRRVLEQKRELLASGGRGLRSWNEVLAAPAAELISLRREYLGLLAGVLEEVMGQEGLGIEPPELRYRVTPASMEEGQEAVLEALEGARRREVETRTPLIGPHRDDLELLWGEKAIRAVASAGERKLVGLGLVAARGRVLAQRGRDPLYLLDDLDAELDKEHLVRVRELFSSSSQVIVTSSRAGVWDGWEGLGRWRISGGETRPG